MNVKKVTTIPATINQFNQLPINTMKKRKVAGYARVSTDTFPSANLFRCPQVQFSLIERDSSCANELIIVISNSPLLSNVHIFSFSKNTSVPFSLSLRIVDRLSTVFLANLKKMEQKYSLKKNDT